MTCILVHGFPVVCANFRAFFWAHLTSESCIEYTPLDNEKSFLPEKWALLDSDLVRVEMINVFGSGSNLLFLIGPKISKQYPCSWDEILSLLNLSHHDQL